MEWLIIVILAGVSAMSLRVAYSQSNEIDQLKTLLRIANLKTLQAKSLLQNQQAGFELDKALGAR